MDGSQFVDLILQGGKKAAKAATLPLDMLGLGPVRRGVSSAKGLLAK